VTEGTSAGDDVEAPAKVRILPKAIGVLPLLPEEHPQWTVFHVQRNGSVYVLLLPADDSWFATPPPPQPKEPTQVEYQFPKSTRPDYKFQFRLNGMKLVEHLGNPDRTGPLTGEISIDYKCDWNIKIPPMPQQSDKSGQGTSEAETLKLGDWFFEESIVYETMRLMEAILSQPNYRPELLVDWRVRAEKAAQDNAEATGTRPDVRSPQFTNDGGLYDLALEEAFGYTKDDTVSWERIALGMTRWLTDDRSAAFRNYVETKLFGKDQPETDQEITSKAELLEERMYAAAEQLRRNRSGLVARLLNEFRGWALGLDTKPGPLLSASGLAFEFKPDTTAKDWQIDVLSLTTNRSFGTTNATHRLIADKEETQLRNASITPLTGGLGFRRIGYQYRIRDILEFQDKDGIHFSWLFECMDNELEPHTMSYEELSGLVTQDIYFEYFDHYSVERINVSQQAQTGNQAENVTQVNVRPGFVPSFLDLGAGARKFFLVAPRFDFSDLFATPAAVGDLLLYRFTAVDVFGNRSQTIEYLTYRKQLEPPPPPDSAEMLYTVGLSEQAVNSEQITISVKPGNNLDGWAGGAIHHELWARALPIASGGYYGLGDDAGEVVSENRPIVDPRGMMLVDVLEPNITNSVITNLDPFRYGTLYEFYVRAVSTDGNASRLMRCQHISSITAGDHFLPERPQAYLERIPAPSNFDSMAVWVTPAEIRSELKTAAEPHPNPDGKGTLIKHVEVRDLSQRELTLHILHHSHTDLQQHHPTGGYQVFAHDRDETGAYKRLAEIEVVSAERYRVTPFATDPWPKWHGRYLRAGEQPAFLVTNASGDGEDLGWLDWGDESHMYANVKKLGLFPEGSELHVILSEILDALKEYAASKGYQVVIHQGRPGPEELTKLTYKSLLENHAEAKDPYGSGLLRWLGRSVDLTFLKGTDIIQTEELLEALTNTASNNMSHYQVMLEVLINGDRRSPMGYYRLSLQPRIQQLQKDPKERWNQQNTAFQTFKTALSQAFVRTAGSSLPGLLDATKESYETLTQRFLRQQPLHDPETLPVALGVAFYEDSGSFSRPLNSDGTIAIQLYYTEQYARRFSYRVQCISRYMPLYRELGIWPAELIPSDD